jgi:hypothetical protein
VDEKKRRFIDHDVIVGLVDECEIEQWSDEVME